jgi:hypothetical protein
MEQSIEAPIVGSIPCMRYVRSFLSEAQQNSLMDKIQTFGVVLFFCAFCSLTCWQEQDVGAA